MNIKPPEIVAIVQKRKSLLIWSTAVMTFVALGYAVLRPTQWSATQALHVRDQSIDTATRNGRFESTDAMQTAQETIYEIAGQRQVLESALREVGPPPGTRNADAWPTPRQIDRFRGRVYVEGPKGAQFGRTELIYITVKDRNRDRAVMLTESVSKNLIERTQRLRQEKYESIIAELEKTVAVGRDDLEQATRRLEEMEKQVGIDIAELRVLVDQGQGEGNVRRTLSEVKAELRREQSLAMQKQVELEQLRSLQDDPRQLILMPNAVLDAQPTLKRLKEGLVDAQLNTARLMGLMSQNHPQVQSARLAEEKIREELHAELQIAIQGLDTDLQAARERLAVLQGYVDVSEGRMGELAGIRTRYSNLAHEVRQRTEFLQRIETELAEARSNKIAATAVSLIHCVDRAIPSTNPVGPSRKLIVLAGFLAGVATGLGLIYIAEPSRGIRRRRAPDSAAAGRRAEDQMRGLTSVFGRRNTDRAARRACDQHRPPATPVRPSEVPRPPQRQVDRRQTPDASKPERQNGGSPGSMAKKPKA